MKKFPILLDPKRKREHPDWPTSVPWSMMASHQAQQAKRNHSQSLERLAERGGLGPLELVVLLMDLPLHDELLDGMNDEAAIDMILANLTWEL